MVVDAGLSVKWCTLGYSDSTRSSRGRGIYIHGGVGVGKSLLMDLFYTSLPSDRKRRSHYHAFMLDVHRRAHMITRRAGYRGDVMTILGSILAEDVDVLCFDEFQVCDAVEQCVRRRLRTETLFCAQWNSDLEGGGVWMC